MNSIHRHTYQHGFFDLGLSLALLALFGTVATATVTNQAVETPQQVTACSGAEKTAMYSERDCEQG